MTHTQLTPTAVLTAVQQICPTPEHPYETALWHTAFAETCETLAADSRSKAAALINIIETQGLTHTDYLLIHPVKAVSRVSIEKLRTVYPQIAHKLTHIRATDAEKLIGRLELCELAQEIAGTRAEQYLRINVTDLEKELGPAEIPAYLITTEKPLEPRIVPKSDARVLV